MKKMLIVFYSWSNGNTERIAKLLQETTGADMARIETVVPYTGSYDDVVQQTTMSCSRVRKKWNEAISRKLDR